MNLHENKDAFGVPLYIKLLIDPLSLSEIISYKRREEKIRAGGIPAHQNICKFSYLHEALESRKLLSEYEKMQRTYIFNDEDRRSVVKAKAVFDVIAQVNLPHLIID